MSNIIVIEKNGDIKVQRFEKFKECDLYKKCGFRKSEGFTNVAEWTVKGWRIMVYARTQGKSGQENNYDFPPPIDTTLFFGNVGVLCYDKDGKLSADESTWNKLYEELFGGFENLDDTAQEDEEEDDELDDVSDEDKTKTGYLKDGFVIDTDSDSVLMEQEYVFTDDEDSMSSTGSV
jgi:hypothetical protein